MGLRDGVHIERWSEEDLALLTALNGDPVQMRDIGGAESAEKIAERQQRYAKDPFQFRIADGGEAAGWVGFWEREWRGEKIYEIGWAVLPPSRAAVWRPRRPRWPSTPHAPLPGCPSTRSRGSRTRRLTRSVASWGSRWSRLTCRSSSRPAP